MGVISSRENWDPILPIKNPFKLNNEVLPILWARIYGLLFDEKEDPNIEIIHRSVKGKAYKISPLFTLEDRDWIPFHRKQRFIQRQQQIEIDSIGNSQLDSLHLPTLRNGSLKLSHELRLVWFLRILDCPSSFIDSLPNSPLLTPRLTPSLFLVSILHYLVRNGSELISQRFISTTLLHIVFISSPEKISWSTKKDSNKTKRMNSIQTKLEEETLLEMESILLSVIKIAQLLNCLLGHPFEYPLVVLDNLYDVKVFEDLWFRFIVNSEDILTQLPTSIQNDFQLLSSCFEQS